MPNLPTLNFLKDLLMGQGCSCFVGTAVKIDSVSMDTSQSATPTKKNGVNGVLVSSLDAEKSLIEAMNLSGTNAISSTPFLCIFNV